MSMLQTGVGTNGAPPFNPDSIPGLQLWLKADAGTFQDSLLTVPAVANNDPVGGWADQSGNGNNALQTVLLDRATLKTAVINGKNVVQLPNNSSVGLMTGLAMPRPYTFIWVEAPLSLVVTSRTLNDGDGSNLLCSAGRSGGLNVFLGGGVSSYQTDATVHELVVTCSSIASHYIVDGTDETTGGTNVADWRNIWLGSSDSEAEAGNTNVCEMLVYNSVLSSGNLTSLRTYLQGRWGTP